MSEFQKWQLKKQERKREKKKEAKDKKEVEKKQGKMTEAEIKASTKEERRLKAELELLIDDKKSSKVTDVDSGNDNRFAKVSKDADFAVDLTHKEFRKVEQGHNKVFKKGTSKRSKH